jgi:hypothetical protein
MLRRIALALCLLVSLVVMIPLVSSTAHNLRSHFSAGSHRRRHSRAWWRRHRAMMRRRQALLARRRALLMARRHGTIPSLAPKTAGNHATPSTAAVLPVTTSTNTPAIALPTGWSPDASVNGAATFRIAPANGVDAHATLSVVAPTAGSQPFGREQRNMVGGASFTELRRTVIDRMISAGGWVVNDRQREIGGRRVFEVIAQTPSSDGKPEQVWNFYFAEINGRVYSLTTRTSGGNNAVAADAERFLSTLSPESAQAKQK